MFTSSFVHPFPHNTHPGSRNSTILITKCASTAPQEPGPLSTPTSPRKLSLPTHREMQFLQTLHLAHPKGRAHRYARSRNLSLMIWPLTQVPTEPEDEPRYPLPPIPPWAYVVHVRAAKSVFGKRAVVRNRAKRRVRAAAAKILPAHAKRGWEYAFGPGPGVLHADFEDLVDDIEECLRNVDCWKDVLVSEEVVRPVYCERYL